MAGRRSGSATGRAGEEAAAAFLVGLGYRIIARNLRFKAGEIDLVAREAGALVFVEVKTRSSATFGSAAEAITPRKQRQLLLLASIYLTGRQEANQACRFDVVTVEPGPEGGWHCRLIRDAFAAG